MEPIIRVEGVSKSFGNNLILDKVNMYIPKEKIFGIIGINGCGKTTLLNLIVGFIKPDIGTIYFESKPINKNMRSVRHKFGFATQHNCFYTHLTVKENLLYFASLYDVPGKEANKRADTLLELVSLNNSRDKLASDLSGGMKRRLDIACALIHDPELLIMDEPTEDLDIALRKDILELIKKINKSGTTVILTSHLLMEIEDVCDDLAIIHNKKVLKEGTMGYFLGNKQEIHLETYPGNYKKISGQLGKTGILKTEIMKHKLIIKTGEPEFVLSKLLKILKSENERLVYIDVKKPSLSEVFENLTKRKE